MTPIFLYSYSEQSVAHTHTHTHTQCVCARAWVGVWTQDHALSNSLLRRSSERPRLENDVDTPKDVCTHTRLI